VRLGIDRTYGDTILKFIKWQENISGEWMNVTAERVRRLRGANGFINGDAHGTRAVVMLDDGSIGFIDSFWINSANGKLTCLGKELGYE
jgi:hypothetical protein